MKWFCLITTVIFLICAGIDRHQLDLFGMIWNLALSLSQLIALATYQLIDEIKKERKSNMIINLNQSCDVILTAHGAEVYNEYFRELHATCKLIELTNLKAEDELSLQLWELMSIFGTHLYNGAENCFANNDISFNDKVVKIPVYTEEEIHEMLKKDLESAYYNSLFLGSKIYTHPWISVKDGLPSVNNYGESKMVFVRVINKHSKEEWIEQPAKYNINIKDWIAMDFTHIGKRNGIVTHWMPIPQLPKEEKK